MATTPGQINFTTTPHNQSNWYLPSGNRYTYGQDIETGFNRQYLDSFWNKGLSIMNDADLDSPGIYTSTQVDTFDFPRYLGLLTDFFSKNSGYLQKSVEMARRGNIFDMGALSPVSPKLEYIDPNNGDQNRRFGVLMNDVEMQTPYRFRITQVTIDRYNADNGTTVTAIPATATRVYLGPDPASGTNTNYIAPLGAGCLSCRPNSCGRGYRMLYFNKNINQRLNPNATYPQTAIPGNIMNETSIVLEYEDAGDGGIYLNLKRGANGTTKDNGSGGLTFESGAISLAVGDFVYVGTIAPSTECIPDKLECATYQPKQFKYCAPIREYIDCIACIDKTRFKTWQYPRDIMSPFEQMSYQVIKNYRNFWHRANNDIMLGSPNYAQGYPFPPQNPGVGATTNGELIPFNVNGILPQFDAFARRLQITLTGCDETCQLYAIDTIMDALNKGGAGMDAIYSQPGWMVVGDVEFLDRYYANQTSSFIPQSADDRIQQMQRTALTYSSNPTSIIRAQNDVQSKLSSEFDRTMDRFGIHLSSIQLGKYRFKALHDRAMAMREPGVVRLIHIPSITFFTDGQDDYMSKMFGVQSPFLPASAVKGRLVPSVVSYDMISTYINGDNKFMAARDCPLNFFAYMRAGVFIKPKMFPYMMKIQFNSAVKNPSYNPADPASPFYIYGDIYNLDCGCMKTARDIEMNLEPWLQPVYYAPIS